MYGKETRLRPKWMNVINGNSLKEKYQRWKKYENESILD